MHEHHHIVLHIAFVAATFAALTLVAHKQEQKGSLPQLRVLVGPTMTVHPLGR